MNSFSCFLKQLPAVAEFSVQFNILKSFGIFSNDTEWGAFEYNKSIYIPYPPKMNEYLFKANGRSVSFGQGERARMIAGFCFAIKAMEDTSKSNSRMKVIEPFLAKTRSALNSFIQTNEEKESVTEFFKIF